MILLLVYGLFVLIAAGLGDRRSSVPTPIISERPMCAGRSDSACTISGFSAA